MESIRAIVEETVRILEEVYDTREAKNISQILMEDVVGVERADVLLGKPARIDKEKLDKYVSRLLKHEPVQYVTGISHFFGRKFNVRPGTLIPRPETEELVQLIVNENGSSSFIADVGTGSGCIAVSLALELNARVLATDFSPNALETARGNAESLKAETEFVLHDILKSNLPYSDLDVLVSNPPYIPEKEAALMNKNVLNHEPKQALFVPDHDPLIFYRRISEAGRVSLKSGGRMYFEIHENFGSETCQIIEQSGFNNVIVHKDMQGRDRMISATNSASR